jgi:hypothetical protein
MIDYAFPMMMAEKHLKLAHDALLLKQWEKAKEELLHAITETRLAYNSVVHIAQDSAKGNT